MPGPPLHRLGGSHIPEEHLPVSTDTRKPSVVIGDGEIEDLVAVGGISLDEARGRRGRRGFDGVVESDGTIGGTAKDLGVEEECQRARSPATTWGE